VGKEVAPVFHRHQRFFVRDKLAVEVDDLRHHANLPIARGPATPKTLARTAGGRRPRSSPATCRPARPFRFPQGGPGGRSAPLGGPPGRPALVRRATTATG